MALPRLAFALASLLVATGGLAGCIGQDEPPAPPTVENVNQTEVPEELPTGEEFKPETNVTEEGVGGIEHKHDYWEGKEQVTVYDEQRIFSELPVYPDGEGSDAKSVIYVKLPQPMLIYEGATTVEFTIGEVILSDGVAHPSPPALSLTYRTAADDAFRDAGSLTPGTPLTLTVGPKETDMPHSVSSLWAFRVETDKPAPGAAAQITILAKKGSSVVDWPGHPDFYSEKTERIVMDQDLKVHRSGIDEFALYGAGSSWNRPEKLISYGTGQVDVFVNITKATSSNGAPPTGFFLEYHNATILDAEDEYNDRIDDEEGGRAFADAFYHFVVPVDAAGMDGPYQPSSRWGFRMVATFAETPVASLCPGCFPYDIEYHMTIVAHKGDDAARING